MQVVLGNAFDVAAHGGGKEQGVALCRNAGQDGIDAFGESHVEHLVSLIEHHVFHLAQAGHAALHQVNQTAGRGHDHLCATFEGADLALYARAAVHGHHVEPVNIA